MDEKTRRARLFFEGFAFGALVAGVLFVVLMAITPHNLFWASGVIDATRGLATAKLVDKPDGTNEWRVERKHAP